MINVKCENPLSNDHSHMNWPTVNMFCSKCNDSLNNLKELKGVEKCERPEVKRKWVEQQQQFKIGDTIEQVSYIKTSRISIVDPLVNYNLFVVTQINLPHDHIGFKVLTDGGAFKGKAYRTFFRKSTKKELNNVN